MEWGGGGGVITMTSLFGKVTIGPHYYLEREGEGRWGGGAVLNNHSSLFSPLWF